MSEHNVIVKKILDQFSEGNRDVRAAYAMIKLDSPAADITIVELSKVLCNISYFNKALSLLEYACKEIKTSYVLFEEVARVAFI